MLAREAVMPTLLGVDLSRSMFGAARLRPPRTYFTTADLARIAAAAAGAGLVVEIGVAEGVSAATLLEAMTASGQLFLVDPFRRGRFGFSASRVTARRMVAEAPGADRRWLRMTSREAAAHRPWSNIDLVNFDGLNDFDGARTHLLEWLPHMRSGATAILRIETRSAGSGSDAGLTLAAASRRQGLLTIVGEGDGIAICRKP